jgi:hypothetical protein
MAEDGAQGAAGHDAPHPWERPGAVRRDGTPHRGNWLRLFGVTSAVLGALSMVLIVPGLRPFLTRPGGAGHSGHAGSTGARRVGQGGHTPREQLQVQSGG